MRLLGCAVSRVLPFQSLQTAGSNAAISSVYHCDESDDCMDMVSSVVIKLCKNLRIVEILFVKVQ